MSRLVTLKFVNRTAEDENGDPEIIQMQIERAAVVNIMNWYGAYYAGDDYDAYVDGREIDMGINGEFSPLTIDA